MSNITFAFFGTDEFSVAVLERLARNGLTPSVVITAPNRPQGRGLVLMSPPATIWAEQHSIRVLQPERLDDDFGATLTAAQCPLFVVASYGSLLPKSILSIPAHGVLNVHPSLLPKYRGSSPLESAILADDKNTGVTIMCMDEKMDHGPIVAQQEISLPDWPPKRSELARMLAEAGGALLSEIIPHWISGKKTSVAQDETRATYTKKITKEDGLIDLTENPYKNFLKIRAFDGWPGTYFFTEQKSKKVRVVIKEARYENDLLRILRVVPEGKKEMEYDDFLRGFQ